MKENGYGLDFSENQLNKEIRRVEHRGRYRSALRATISSLLVIAAIALIVATLWIPILLVSGDSMEPTLRSGQVTVGYRTQDLAQGDIAAFYYEGKLILSRVIARSGDWVNLNAQGQITVNDEIFSLPYDGESVLKSDDLTYPFQVPDGYFFVLGDNPNASADSRNGAIGCVAQDKIAARIVFCIWPLQRLEYFG